MDDVSLEDQLDGNIRDFARSQQEDRTLRTVFQDPTVYGEQQAQGSFSRQNFESTVIFCYYVAQHDCWRLTRVHEHAGSGATHLSLVAHHP